MTILLIAIAGLTAAIIAIRRCPLVRAIGRQVDLVASRR